MKFVPILISDDRPQSGFTVAFLGGGGKTSLIRRMGLELTEQRRVLLTTLTKSGPHPELNPVFLQETETKDLLSRWETNPIFLMGSRITAKKYQGIEAAELERIRHQTDITLVENDGSRNLPLKIHNDYDPPVPEFVDQVIIVVGADTVGRMPMKIVHRWEAFCPYWDWSPDAPLTERFIARVVTSEKGYLSKVPNRRNLLYFVNKSDVNPSAARHLAQAIGMMTTAPVYWGSVREGTLNRISDV
ncbi:MAG: putative selenium-dependent hydroxylase accessory protein YqeC [FCB group bacterium]|nr:putative selenium-dependent hydroxylase accessory protein YqeC [FCB group bacterium]